VVGVAGARPWQAGLDVDDQRLRSVQFGVVDADHRFASKTFDEDQVQWAGLGLGRAGGHQGAHGIHGRKLSKSAEGRLHRMNRTSSKLQAMTRLKAWRFTGRSARGCIGSFTDHPGGGGRSRMREILPNLRLDARSTA
jgi:hypothetical protein